MKIENMLQRFSCISFLFKPPCLNQTLNQISNTAYLSRYKLGEEKVCDWTNVSQHAPKMHFRCALRSYLEDNFLQRTLFCV